MSKKGYEYLAKCLAASMCAHFSRTTVEYQMRLNKGNQPGEHYYAIASLLVSAFLGNTLEDFERLSQALKGHPK